MTTATACSSADSRHVRSRLPITATRPAAEHSVRPTAHVTTCLLTALLSMTAVVAAAPAAAEDSPCGDVVVIFARGTFEAPGVGATGEVFVDALETRLPGRTVDVEPVEYPASLDFQRAAEGVVDATARISGIARDCPSTGIVLGGYSQGAAVAAYATMDTVPAGYPLPDGITGPLPADIARHVAAVALFGKPSTGFLNLVDRSAPPILVGRDFAAKTIELCVIGDPVCSPSGRERSAHSAYKVNGMAEQAADFAVSAIDVRD